MEAIKEKFNILKSGGYGRSNPLSGAATLLVDILNTDKNYNVPVIDGLIEECYLYQDIIMLAELPEIFELLEITKDKITSKATGGTIHFLYPAVNRKKTDQHITQMSVEKPIDRRPMYSWGHDSDDEE